MRRIRRAALVTFLLLAALQRVAFADFQPLGPVKTASDPQSKNAGLGVDSMVKAPDLRGGNQPMLFEKYAPLDYTPLNVDPGSAGIGLITNPQNQTAATFGNLVADIEAVSLLAIATISTRAVEWALSLDLVSAVGNHIGPIVAGIRDSFTTQAQPIALAAVGIMLVWAIAVARVIRALSVIAWAVIAIAVGSILMANPVGYTSDVQNFMNWTSQQALASIGKVDVGGLNRDATTSQGSVPNAEVRTFANRAWYLWAYSPWTVMEFGTNDPKVPGTDRQLGVELLDKNSGRPSTFDADFQKEDQGLKDWYNGDRGIERAGVGVVALVLAIAAALLQLGIVFMIVRAAIGVLFLVLGMPFVFAIAPLHTFFLLKWLELLIKNFVTVVLMSILLGVVMLLAGLISVVATDWGWFVAAALQLVVLGWAFWNRGAFLTMGHRIGHPRLQSASAPQLQQSQTAVTADRHLHTAQRRMVAPLQPARQRALTASNNGSETEATKQTPTTGPKPRQTAHLAQQAASNAAGQTVGRAATGAGGKVVAGTSTAGLYLAGAAVVKGGRMVVRGYHSLRHQSQAPLAHFMGGGMPSRPALPQRGSSPSLLWMGTQQVRAARAMKRLPSPQQPTPPSAANGSAPRPQRPRRAPSVPRQGGRPPIQLLKSGARVTAVKPKKAPGS